MRSVGFSARRPGPHAERENLARYLDPAGAGSDLLPEGEGDENENTSGEGKYVKEKGGKKSFAGRGQKLCRENTKKIWNIS